MTARLAGTTKTGWRTILSAAFALATSGHALAQTPPRELVPNGGFESGSLAGWTLESAGEVLDTTYALPSTEGEKLAIVKTAAGEEEASAITVPIPIDPCPKRILVDIRVVSPSLPSGLVSVRVEARNAQSFALLGAASKTRTSASFQPIPTTAGMNFASDLMVLDATFDPAGATEVRFKVSVRQLGTVLPGQTVGEVIDNVGTIDICPAIAFDSWARHVGNGFPPLLNPPTPMDRNDGKILLNTGSFHFDICGATGPGTLGMENIRGRMGVPRTSLCDPCT